MTDTENTHFILVYTFGIHDDQFRQALIETVLNIDNEIIVDEEVLESNLVSQMESRSFDGYIQIRNQYIESMFNLDFLLFEELNFPI